MDFLTQLENKGLERLVFENNLVLNPVKKQYIIPAQSIMVANLVYNSLDCATKFCLKYVMQGAIDTYERSDCEKVEIQHIYGRTKFSTSNQVLNLLNQFKDRTLTKRPCICSTKIFSEMGQNQGVITFARQIVTRMHFGTYSTNEHILKLPNRNVYVIAKSENTRAAGAADFT